MVSEDLWEEWLQFVLVLCQAHSTTLSFSVLWKRVTQKGVPGQGQHDFSPQEWLFQPQSFRILSACTACWTAPWEVAHIWSIAQHFPDSQTFLRNKPILHTLQMRKSNHFSSLVVNQEYSWGPWSLLSFSAYQSDMEMHILQLPVNLEAMLTKHFDKMLTSVLILTRNAFNSHFYSSVNNQMLFDWEVSMRVSEKPLRSKTM